MDKRRMTYMTMGFGILLLLVMILLVWGGRRQSGQIVLPESQSDSTGPGEDGTASRLDTISITPETVGPAVGALARPAAYSRTQTVETFWSGGSGQTVIQVYVSGSRTRLDETMQDGSVRHTLVESGAPSVTGVWYDDETEWVRLRSEEGRTSADRAGRMPTYETVRELRTADILQADYREAYGGECIFVESRDGAYTERYWVRVDSGLLAAAERLWQDQVVYRLTAGEPVISPQEESLFLLPDGSALS